MVGVIAIMSLSLIHSRICRIRCGDYYARVDSTSISRLLGFIYVKEFIFDNMLFCLLCKFCDE